MGVKIVEDEDVEPSVERLAVRDDVRRHARFSRRRAHNGNLYGSKRLDGLAGAFLQQLEVVAGEPRDGIAPLVEHANVDLHRFDAGPERPRVAHGAGLLRLRRGGHEQGRGENG
jgi:hypothetical protein